MQGRRADAEGGDEQQAAGEPGRRTAPATAAGRSGGGCIYYSLARMSASYRAVHIRWIIKSAVKQVGIAADDRVALPAARATAAVPGMPQADSSAPVAKQASEADTREPRKRASDPRAAPSPKRRL